MTVTADTQLPLGVLQGDVLDLLYQVGREGWDLCSDPADAPDGARR